MPVAVQGVVHGASVGIGTTVTKGNGVDPTIGVVGNSYITIDPQVSIDDLTLGQFVAGNAGVATGTKIIGIDRSYRTIYLDKPLVDNIQVATDPSVTFSFGKISFTNHGLKAETSSTLTLVLVTQLLNLMFTLYLMYQTQMSL